MKNCVKIGITGGTGSGKSTVCDHLRRLGYEVIDSDKIARTLLTPGTKEYVAVTEHFGDGILSSSCASINTDNVTQINSSKITTARKGICEIDRKKLGEIVFASRSELEFLENVVTKGTIEEIRRIIGNFCNCSTCSIQGINNAEKSRIIFVDAPILFETGFNKEMDYVWVVYSCKALRLNRLAKRDGLTVEKLEQRMGSQMPEEEKIARADFVIENNGTITELIVQIEDELDKLRT